jgi:hypothetical protein
VSVLRLHRHTGNFTAIDNRAVQDGRLSLKARGLHHLLLSKFDGSTVNAAEVARECTDGRDAIQAAMRELERCGYLAHRREQDARGRWRTFTDVYELPEGSPDEPAEPAPEPGFPAPEDPHATGAGFSRAGEPERSDPDDTGNGFSGAGKSRAIGNKTVRVREPLPPSVVAAPPLEPTPAAAEMPAPNPAGEVVPLRSGRAVAAANGVLERLKAEVEAGRRSWSFTDAAKAEWDALLDDDRNLSAAQQFLVWFIAQNRGVDIRTLDRLDWSMAGQKVNRWRSLALYGVDQAVTRNLTGLDFWRYAEKVCQAASAELRQGTP